MQTDMMDLLGSDLPVESDEDMKFAWSDGILLQVKECLMLKYVSIQKLQTLNYVISSGSKRRLLGFAG